MIRRNITLKDETFEEIKDYAKSKNWSFDYYGGILIERAWKEVKRLEEKNKKKSGNGKPKADPLS